MLEARSLPVRLLLTLGLLLLLTACGCQPSHLVRINSYLEQGQVARLVPGSTLTIRPDPKAANPIFERQVGAKFSWALNNSGYRVAGEGGEFAASFTYGVEKGTRTVLRTVYGPSVPVRIVTKDDRGRVIRTEEYQRNETSQVPVREEVYHRWLSLKISRASDGQAVWIGKARDSSISRDLRPAMNYLIAGLVQYVGKDTGQEIAVSLNSESPLIRLLATTSPGAVK